MAPTKVTTEIVNITPAKAEQMLAANTHNRPLRQRTVEQLQGAIERGEWLFNGDAIRFDNEGVLVDGQHRLWAIALGTTTVRCLVVRGLEQESQMTMDLGTRRNLGDQLRLMGYKSTSNLAAILVSKWKLDNGLMQTTAKPTIQQALRVLEENPTIVDSVKAYNNLRQGTAMSTSSVLGMLHYECMSIDQAAAETFFGRLGDGVGLEANDPIYKLRERLMATKTSVVQQAALTIKAWNLFMEGRKVESLMWKAVGTSAEAFPKLAS